MIRIGTVWDRTCAVIAGRAGLLAWLAGLFLFLPSLLQTILRFVAASGGAGGGFKGLVALVGLAVAALAIWGVLAMTAMASDPAVDRHEAIALARRRLPAAIGLLLVAMLMTLIVVAVPMAWLLAGNVDMAKLQQGAQPVIDPARAGSALIGFLILGLLALWISARLIPLFAVIANERRGFGAFARAFALTRGSTLKLLGVTILYAVLAVVLLTAVTWVLGSVGQILLGRNGAFLLVALATSVLTAGFSVIQTVFSAQFYVAAREQLDHA